MNGKETMLDTAFLMSQPLIFFSAVMLLGLPVAILWVFKKEFISMSKKQKIQSVALLTVFLFLHLLLFASLLPQLRTILPGLVAYLTETEFLIPFTSTWILFFGLFGIFLARKILLFRVSRQLL